MTQAVSDLFKKFKELEDTIKANGDQWDTDYQNVLDRLKSLDVKQDSLRTNITHISQRLATIHKRLERIEKELGIDEKKKSDTPMPEYYGL